MKLRKTSYMLNHLRYCCNKNVLSKVYFALGESHIRYGITAWGTSRKCNQLQKSQNKLLKILKKAHIENKYLNVNQIFKMSIINEYYNATVYKQTINHIYGTRRAKEGRFKMAQFLNRYGKFALPSLVPTLLNELPTYLLNIANVYARKKALKEFFIKQNN